MAIHDDQADAFLRPRFADYRADTLGRLRPPGAASARRAYETRRTSRMIAVAVATVATIVLAAAGGTALLRRSSPPLPVIVSPTPQTVSPTPSAPSPTTPGTPPAASHSIEPGSAGTPTPSRTGSGTPRCHTSDLSIRSIGGDGHSGSATNYFALTNSSADACSLAGFPALRAVDSKGSRLPTTLERVGTAKPTIRLQPGTAAYISITTTNIPGTDPVRAPCEPPAAALWLIPPGESEHLTVGGSWRIVWRRKHSGYPVRSPTSRRRAFLGPVSKSQAGQWL